MLGAIDDVGKVTDIGRLMSKFPLEPNLSRAVVEASSV
jgi:HrpA-like RNA helicase